MAPNMGRGRDAVCRGRDAVGRGRDAVGSLGKKYVKSSISDQQKVAKTSPEIAKTHL